jgi:pyroglutamyl-peptidase
VNPACEIATLLPDYLPADRVKDVVAHRSSARRDMPPVRIVKLSSGPVRTSYEYVRDLVPKLWDNEDGTESKSKIDYAIHIGMAGPQLVYSIERRGHRDGYVQKDVDGKCLEDEKTHAELGEKWIWHGAPHELLSDFDVDDIHRRWVARSPVRRIDPSTCHSS